MVEIKKQLFDFCSQKIESQIASIGKDLEALQQSSNNETKSSAGDKYETGRSMIQLEKDKLLERLGETLKSKQVLSLLNPEKITTKGELGSLLYTSAGIFYLSLPLGKINTLGKDYFLISPVSPLGAKFMGIKPKEVVKFNDREYKIEGIF